MSLDTLLDSLEQVTPATSHDNQRLPDNPLQNSNVSQVTPATPIKYISVKNSAITSEHKTISQTEERRLKVLSMLAENPGKQRVYVTDDKAEPDHVVLTVAIRNLASFEMLIPKAKYDPFALIELINKALDE